MLSFGRDVPPPILPTQVLWTSYVKARPSMKYLKKPLVILSPLLGMGLFVILYTLAALTYPGGSYADPHHDSFSFWNNYLCDLLDTYTIGGVLNPARIFARAALLILCLSLIFLWYQLPKLFPKKNRNQRIMQIAGVGSLIITLLLSAGNHDLIVRIAGFFGVIALIMAFIELVKVKYMGLFLWGLLCLLVFFANYYIYETGIYLEKLPVIQKITFVGFIIWFLLLNTRLYQNQKNAHQSNLKP